MKEISAKSIENAVAKTVYGACTSPSPACVRCALESAAKSETSALAKFALDRLLENNEIAEKTGNPLCQDTGMAVFFVTLGQDVHITGGLLLDAINAGVKKGYAKLRKSVLDPITRVNTGDNTPAIIHIDLAAGDSVKIDFMAKGFGSENMSRLFMLTPSAGLEGVADSVVKAIEEAGSNPCPPVIVGVGIGGTSEKAMEVAKRQLFRDADDVNPDAALAEMEKNILSRINALPIGAQGFGGNHTALAVKIGKFPTHICALPVAVNIQCHAVRTGRIEL